MLSIDVLRWLGGSTGKGFGKAEFLEQNHSGFAATEIAVDRAYRQQARLKRFLEPSNKAVQVQGRSPQEVELDAADNDFLAAFVAVIEAHGQTQRELVGIVVDNAEKKRRDAQDQVDDVNKKWQSTQDTCNDYKGRLEQASTNAAHVKEMARLQADNQSAQQRWRTRTGCFHFAPFLDCLITPMRPCLQGIAHLQAVNQSARQSRKEAEGRAAAMVNENRTLLAQAKDAEFKQQLEAAGALETDLRAQLNVVHAQLRENAQVQQNAQLQQAMQCWFDSCQVSKAARKKVKTQQKAVQLAAKEEASAAAPSPVEGTSSAPATTSGAELQVAKIADDNATASGRSEESSTDAPVSPSEQGTAKSEMTKGQRKKAKKQQKAVVQLTQSMPAAPSAMEGTSSAPATTSGAELQVAKLHEDRATPSGRGEECRADAPASPSEQGEARPEMTKSQRKKAKKQQKAAMQLTQSSPDSPSTRDGASSAPTTTSGAELQVHVDRATPSGRGEKSRAEPPFSPSEPGEARPQVLNSDASSASGGSPPESPTSVFHMRHQLTQAQKHLDVLRLENETMKARLTTAEAKYQTPEYWLTDDWQLGEPIGLGISGLILAATNPPFPNAILKKGSALHLDHEAEKLWVVRHPNVVQLYGMLGSHEDQPDGSPTAYLALKREGPDLATLLNDPSHGITLREIIVGFQGLAAGMAHMHSKGVVDQDFHAGNVLLSQDGQTLVKTDLGSAAWTETDGQPTFLDRCWCGAGFESPQIAKGCLQDGGYEPLPSSDVHAFGVLLLETVGGQQPQQQIELQRSTAYLTELRDGFFDPTQVPGQRKHLEWLRDLLVDPTKPDYADLVQLPSWLQGNVTGSSPEAQLKQIIRSCLHTASQQRPSASRVQELLYNIMVQQGWSNQMRPVAAKK
ncbi:hypothetical protein WJX82_002306 [Trebouxia sp. C0006]